MIFKRLHVGTTSFSDENFPEVKRHVADFFGEKPEAVPEQG
jgi:hypothetical protein